MKTMTPNPFRGKAATTVFDMSCREGLKTAVRYHDTNIVAFTPSAVVLNSGGWRTATTKRRMNEVSDHYGLRFHIYQEDFKWWVVLHDSHLTSRTMPFSDGMQFPRV